MTSQNGLLIFSGKRHIPKLNHGNRRGFRRKSYNSNGNPWKSSRTFRVKPNFFIFFIVQHFSHFPHFSFFFFSFFFFSFFHFFHFFVFFVSGFLEIRFFFVGLKCFKISGDISFQKIIFLSRGPLFLFSRLFFLFFFSLVTYFSFFLKKKFLLFFFSCISFKNVILLASVSVRSRCSMEMCVLTAEGGIAGIGLGRLLGREHGSTPQVGWTLLAC